MRGAELDAARGAISVDGNPAAAGQFLNADVEGLAIYYARNERGYLLMSSQGDDTFHVYGRIGRAALGGRHKHLATFEPINGFEFDNATHFKLLGWDDIARPLNLDVWTPTHTTRGAHRRPDSEIE